MSVRLDHGGDDLPENHEINVTPFIDVMLVLLIIFMIAAPLATVSVPVDLPDSNADLQDPPPEPVYLTVQADLSWSLGDDPVEAEALAARLDALTGADRDRRVFLRADEKVDYGELMGAMNALRSAGYLKIALVGAEASTQP